MYSRLLAIAIGALVVSSCQEKISLKLKNGGPFVVIEGLVSDQSGEPARVGVTETISYDDTTTFKGLANAVVTISDGATTDTLQAGPFDGIYFSTNTHAQVGKSYKLHVEVKGQTYESVSYVPAPVGIDSVYKTTTGFSNDVRIACQFRDPVGLGNYYKAGIKVNGVEHSINEVTDDKLTDGKLRTININSKVDYKSGDVIEVSLQSIDKDVYEYFYTLRQNTGRNSASPANPVSNVTNGALGYFEAYSVVKKTFIYP